MSREGAWGSILSATSVMHLNRLCRLHLLHSSLQYSYPHRRRKLWSLTLPLVPLENASSVNWGPIRSLWPLGNLLHPFRTSDAITPLTIINSRLLSHFFGRSTTRKHTVCNILPNTYIRREEEKEGACVHPSWSDIIKSVYTIFK